MERRKARLQAKRMEKKAASKDGRSGSSTAVLATGAVTDAAKIGSMGAGSIGTKDVDQGMGRPILANAQNTLNTTVWNSSIVREQTIHASPPIEKYALFLFRIFPNLKNSSNRSTLYDQMLPGA